MGQLEDALENRLAEYKSLLRQGAHASAFTRLAEVLNVVEHSELPNRVRYGLIGRVEEAAKSIGRESVQSGFEADLARIRKICSVGSRFNEDEVLLLLTIRVQLQLAGELYAHLGWSTEGLADPEIDSAMQDIMRSNEKSTQKALGLARKNWGLPLVTDWL